jgi:hypothetical protein
MPTITIDDVAALLDPLLVTSFIPARQKFQDLVANYLWVQMCQCDSGGNPPVPTAPSALANFDSTPPVSGAVVQPSCVEIERLFYVGDLTLNHPTTGSGDSYGITRLLGLTAGPDRTISPYPLPFHTALVPAGATHYQWIITTEANGPTPSAHADLAFSIFNSGNTLLGGSIPNVPITGATVTGAITALPTGSNYFFVEWQGNPDPLPTLDLTLRFYCNSQTTGTVVQPCCPPDPIATATLQQILGYVTLLQRQIAPFAYISGASHSISGHGEIAVQGLIGCRVTLDALDGDVGVDVGDPNNLWQAGWINWGNADGFSDRRFLTSSPFVSFPSQAGQYTRIGYSLPRSLSAALVELRREA